MKCMDQIPVPPMAQAANTSHHARCPVVRADLARAVQVKPSNDPRIDNRYATPGVIKPYVK